MNVDISLYRVFCFVARYNNISKAAEELFVSQSAVTQSIKKLESEIGDVLFYRTRKGVELTESGKILFDYLNDNIERIENAENIFSKYLSLEKGDLRIGGGSALMNAIIIPPIKEFCKKYPKINILLTNGKTDELFDMLSLGKIDAVVHFLPYKSEHSLIQTISIKASPYCLFCSKEYYKKNKINQVKNLSNLRMIIPKKATNKYKIFEKLMKDIEYDKENLFEVSGTELQNKLILDGFGIGFSNVDVIKDIIDKVEIIHKFKTDESTIAISTLNKEKMNVVSKEFLKEIKNYYSIK